MLGSLLCLGLTTAWALLAKRVLQCFSLAVLQTSVLSPGLFQAVLLTLPHKKLELKLEVEAVKVAVKLEVKEKVEVMFEEL